MLNFFSSHYPPITQLYKHMQYINAFNTKKNYCAKQHFAHIFSLFCAKPWPPKRLNITSFIMANYFPYILR